MLMNTQEYLSVIEKIKQEIKDAQYCATIHANTDLLLLYYDIGMVINEYKTWGNKFIDNLSYDIQIAFPERKEYSVRKLKYMAKSGMNPKTLQYLMGHSDIAVTLNVYTHVGLEDAEKELQKMQGLENARKEMGISDMDDKPLKQNMFKVI